MESLFIDARAKIMNRNDCSRHARKLSGHGVNLAEMAKLASFCVRISTGKEEQLEGQYYKAKLVPQGKPVGGPFSSLVAHILKLGDCSQWFGCPFFRGVVHRRGIQDNLLFIWSYKTSPPVIKKMGRDWEENSK